ncbi:UNVERIFIED_CONTAM: putative inactive histone-lysine N-methyltransferase SUVR1 [Sesamum radiatum]|uniref:Inactive histone-lysine N-methyltransferase SUVR1 n=1 Tax=Sesamum radiatum TaxID=300843 RepID=A0AAW2TF00_SESRA
MKNFSQVGLSRMHAALDAMRPMGFSTDTVRKCVKKLLKVYGDDGWLFIEEAAYKLLIDMILEEPDVPQLDHAPEHLLLEGGKHGSDEHSESLHELCDKEVISEKQVSVTDFHVAEAHNEDIDAGLEKSREQDLDVKVTPMLLQDVLAQHQAGVQSGHALIHTPQPTDGIPFRRRCKPCYGWISDDEDDEFSAVEPS